MTRMTRDERVQASGLDDALRVGASFDWISPAIAIAKDIAHGGGTTFEIDRHCGMTGYEIRHILDRSHVKSWGLSIHGDDFMITVDKKDTARAEAALRRAGLA